MGKYLDKANKTINKVETVGSKYSYTPPVASKVTPKATPKATTPKKEVKTPASLGPIARGIPGGRAAMPTPKAKTDTPPVKQRTLPQSSPPSNLMLPGVRGIVLPNMYSNVQLSTSDRNMTAGFGSIESFAGGALDYIGNKLGAESVSNTGKALVNRGNETLKKYSVPYSKDFTWKSLVDPEFYQTTISQSFPLMGALLLSAGVGAVAGGTVAGVTGAGAFATGALKAIGAGAFSGVIETLGEAGSAFEESLKRGMSPEEADNNADYVFKANAALKMKDPLEWLLAFTPVGKIGGKLAKVATKAGKAGTVAKVAGKGAIIAGMEGGEEVLQEKFQADALGDPFELDTPENRETFAVGAFYGLMMTGMGTAMNHIKAKTISTMDPAERSRFDNAVGNLESAGLDRGSATGAVIDEYAKTPKGESHIEKVMGDVISQAEASVPLKNSGVELEQETIEGDYAQEDVETPTEAILTRKEHINNILEESNPDMQEHIKIGYKEAKKAGVVDAITQALEEGQSEMDIAKEIAPKLKSKRQMVDAVAMIKSVDAVNAMADERIIVDSAKRGTKETKEGGKENVSTVQKRNQSTDEARLLGLGELEKRIHSELAGQIPEGTTVYELATNETKDIEAARGIGRIFNHEIIHFNVKSDVTGKVRSHANGFNGAIIGDKIYINSDRTNSAHAVAGHEVTHAILKDKEIAKPFLDVLTNLITDEGMKQIDSIVENYKRVGLVVTREEAIEEFAGDFIGEQMTKKEFWDELAKKVPDAVKKAIEVLNKIIKGIRAKVGKNNQAGQYLLDLEVARSLAVEAVALHLNKEAATKANLTQEERGILEGFRKQGTTLSSVIESIDFTMNEIINDQISYMKSSSGKGVEQGNVTFTEDGEFASKSPRVSRNPKWYQDFYADYGRAPRKGEFREIAIDQLRNGFPDFTMEIPPNEQFIELEGAKNVYQTIEQKLSTGMEQELSEQGNEGDSGDSKTVNFQAKEEVNSIKELRDKYPDVDMYLAEKRDGKISLDRIIISKKSRQKGVGSAVMTDLIDMADRQGKTIVLTPSIDYGASSKQRLIDFYKRFGFVQNKGKNTDFTISDTMYRSPKPSFQLKSPAFQKWFGDSKVVDDDGNPRIMYHGTGVDITEFKHGLGNVNKDGIWFGPKRTAEEYAEYRGKGTPKVMGVYLSIKNPKETDFMDTQDWIERVGNKLVVRENAPTVQSYIDAGYDGIYLLDKDEWIAFKPEQVKSATDNQGTFDAENPDIRYQLKSDAFENWFGESKVVDEKGMPKPLYSGHSNIELYGDSFDPKKATAGGFFATDNPDIASNYASEKVGIKEYWDNGDQYRIYNPKTKKFNKKIREITLTDEQIQVFNEWWEENYGGTLSQYIKDNSRSDAKLRKYQYLGSSNNLEAFWYVMETMGDTIAYAKPGDEPLYVRQQKSTFEELLDKAGIKWQSYEWMQPGVMKVFLKIENPLDTSKPLPVDVMASLEKIAKREKRMTDDEWMDAHWTKDYPVYKWIEDIKKMEDTGEETFWATQIPTKARKVLKEFGYDGIKDIGGKMGGAGHEVWIALDSNQVKSAIGNKGTFKEADKRIQFQLKEQKVIEAAKSFDPDKPYTINNFSWSDIPLVEKYFTNIVVDGDKLIAREKKTNTNNVPKVKQAPSTRATLAYAESQKVIQEYPDKEASMKKHPWKDDRNAATIELVPINLVQRYMELDRRNRPANNPDELTELTKSILENGIEEPLIIEYNPQTGFATLGEGNHRLVIAEDIGYAELPVRILRNKYIEPTPKRGGTYVFNGKIPLTTGYVNGDLKPSEVFSDEELSGKVKYQLKTKYSLDELENMKPIVPLDETFAKAFENTAVVDAKGKPMVVYHGTTHDWTQYSPEKGNINNHVGIGFYATSDLSDALSNYGENGGDLNARIEDRVGEILMMFEYDSAYDVASTWYSDEQITDELLEKLDDFEEQESFAREIAKSELVGNSEGIMPVFLNITNPVILDWQGGTLFKLEDKSTLQKATRDASEGYTNINDAGLMEMVDELTFEDNDVTAWEVFAAMNGDYAFGAILLENGQENASGQFAQDVFKAMGYDGVIYNNVDTVFHGMKLNPGTKHYVAFNPKQIKSATGNTGAWDMDNSDIRYQMKTVPPFYSVLQKAIEAKMPDKTKVDQVLKIIDNPQNVKPEEVKWSGLKLWLQGRDKVTKAEILEFLAGNDLKIEEVTKGVGLTVEEAVKVLIEGGTDVEKVGDRYRVDGDIDTFSENEVIRMVLDYSDAEEDGTKFSRYVLPGGEKYRELLFVVPEQEIMIDPTAKEREREALLREFDNDMKSMSADTFRQKYNIGQTENPLWVRGRILKGLMEVKSKVNPVLVPKNAYTSQHWDEKNVLAHTRFNERLTPDGKRVLFVEEVQSDWLQALREGKDVPDAPFRKTWHEFVLKRLLRLAAENNMDYLAWTTGEQQASRYDLSKQAKEVIWFKEKENQYTLRVTGLDDQLVYNEYGLPLDKIEQIIGKDMARKIADSDKTHDSISGEGLKVGGKGMKSFYDIGGKSSQNIPSFLRKYGKQWGAKIEDIIINIGGGKPTQYEDYHEWMKAKDGLEKTQPAINITDDMKRSVLYEGQPRFQLKPIEDRDLKERSFPLTVEEAPWTSDEAKEEINIDRTIFTKAYYYDVAHNPDTIAEAERLIKEDRSSAMDRAMSDKPDHVGTAISLLLMKEAHDSQDWSTFLDLLEHTSEKGTKMGQDIQVLSLWGRITPEGIVRYAKRVFDKATTPKQDDEIKRLTGQIEEGMDEANKRAVDDVLKLIAPTLDELKRMSAAEKLAKMISGHLKKPSERNMWKEMVKTLYTIAKEEAPLPEKAKLEKMNYMSFIGDALRNRDRYMDVWEKAKYTVTDKYKNDPDAQEKLKAYFDMVVNQPYPDSYLNKAIGDELKALGVKISDLAKAHYSKANTFKGTFAQRLVEQAGLDKVEAKHLENMIYQRMTEATLKEKEKILSRMFKPREKRKQRELWQKILELSNLGGFQLPQYKQLVAEKLGLPRLSKKLNESLYLQAQIIQTMSDGREKHVAIQQMMQDITNAVPSTVAQKVSTVQTMMQLLNPKTIIRNLVGNSGFGVLENISELVAVPLDLVATSVLDAGKHTKIKTASGPQLKAQWEGLQEGWKLGLEDALLGIDTSNNRTQFDLPKGRTFKTGIFSGLETVLNVALRATDRAFYMAALKSSLASQMEAAKTDVPTEEMLKNAALVGLYRTFQDDNNITKMAVGLKRVMNIAGLDKLGLGKPGEFGLGDIVFKYPKTPSNLLARGLDYSPAGLVISISKLLADTSGDKYLRREILVKGTSRAVTGTTLMVLGWWLATLKLVVGNREDDYDIRAVNKTAGLWDNQINVSGLWRFLLSGFNADAAKMKKGDTLVSYDWFQPQSINIAMGADIAQNDAQFTGFMGTLMGSIEAATNTLAEQPMVTGLTRLFKGEISQAFTETLKSIPSSFTPTFLNQLTQFLDNQKKEVYDPNWSNVAINLARKKVPGASDLLPNAVDVWGEDMENYQNDTNSFFNVFFNPAFVQKYDPSPEAQLVLDLYERTGEAKIAPRLQKKTIRIDSQDVVLSPAEYTALQKFVGQKTQEKYQEYARSRRTGLPDEIQIKQLYNILNDVGADGRDFVKQMRGLK